MTTSQDAKVFATGGFRDIFGRDATPSELLMLMGVGRLETSFGDGWKGAGAGSNNMGAIIAGTSWDGDVFENRDSYPDAQGVNHWYVTKFRRYPTPEDGWKDLELATVRWQSSHGLPSDGIVRPEMWSMP